MVDAANFCQWKICRILLHRNSQEAVLSLTQRDRLTLSTCREKWCPSLPWNSLDTLLAGLMTSRLAVTRQKQAFFTETPAVRFLFQATICDLWGQQPSVDRLSWTWTLSLFSPLLKPDHGHVGKLAALKFMSSDSWIQQGSLVLTCILQFWILSWGVSLFSSVSCKSGVNGNTHLTGWPWRLKV